MVAAEITRPPTSTRNPVGRVLEVLGRLEDPGVDLRVIHGQVRPARAFPPEVEEEAARVPQEVRPQDTRGRTDFRGAAVVTVDPETARDHDDAISLERRGSAWRLGVHIADVAHYVRRGHAAGRGGLPARHVRLLPGDRGAHAAARALQRHLQPGGGAGPAHAVGGAGHRRAGTRPEGGVPRRRHPLRARAELPAGRRPSWTATRRCARASRTWCGLVRDMDALARQMRRRRYERGSLDFDVPEPKVRLGPSGEIDGHRGHRAAGQHARDRGVHAGRQRGGGGKAARLGGGRALPHPRAARPREGGGVRRSGRPRSATAFPETWRTCRRRTCSGSSARSRASPRSASSPTSCCAP